MRHACVSAAWPAAALGTRHCPAPCAARPTPGAVRVQKYRPLIEKLPPKPRFLMHRAMDNWKYGAGKDYTL